MKNQDILQKFLFENASVRGELVRLHESYKTIVMQHQYPLFIQKILGEALAAIVLLSATIKFQGRLTLQFQGKGKLNLLLAQCNHQHEIRGLAQWKDNLTENQLTEALQNGILAIIMDPLSSSDKPYQGIVTWQGNSLSQSIENYFRESEQLTTRLWLAVEDNQAAGLLLQKVPQADTLLKESTSQDEQPWDKIIHLTDTLTSQELLHLDNETLLRHLYSNDNEIRLFDTAPITFHCPCSEERSKNILMLLGREEVEKELVGKQHITVTCEFCSRQYIFNRTDIENIFKNKGGGSTAIH